ncbi:MAG: hypothetical protein K2L98_04095 [Bacilli bacterium]|nr:hypothetical protein [Bacilli bacterium]
MIFGILKFIFLYFLCETISGIGVCAEVGATMIIEWLRTLKTERIIPFSSYYIIFSKKLKEISYKNEKRHILCLLIPFINMLEALPHLVKASKETINSPEYMEESHEISNIERERIAEIKRENGLNIVNKVKELDRFVIRPLDVETVLKKGPEGKFYMIGETYNFDECSYVSFGTNMRITFGKINGNMYAIFDAWSTEEIKEIFPNFVSVDPDEITDEEMTLIFLRRPNDADICYIITSILYNRDNRETVDSEIVPEEPSGSDIIVKLTK